MISFNVITPFPAMFDAVLNESILLKAKQKNIAEYNIFNLFNYLDNSSDRIDDYPFGGGEGMLLKASALVIFLLIGVPVGSSTTWNKSPAAMLSPKSDNAVTFLSAIFFLLLTLSGMLL